MLFKKLVKIVQYVFYSKDFYIDLYHNVSGLKFHYLLAVLFIANLSFVVPTYTFLKNALESSAILEDSNLNYIAKQLPESFTIKDNALEIPETIPQVIFSENENLPLLGFVTNNNLNSLKSKDVPVIIAKDGAYILADNQYLFINLSMHLPKEDSISPKMIAEQIKTVKNNWGILAGFFYIIATLAKAIFVCLNLLFFSIFGFLYMKLLKRTPRFLSIYRIAIFAVIPSIIIESIFNLYIALIKHSFFDFIDTVNSSFKSNVVFFVAIGYFYYALFYITKDQTRKEII